MPARQIADPHRLFRAVAEYAQSLYPGCRSAKVQIVLSDGEMATIPVPATAMCHCHEPPAGAMVEAIMQVLHEQAPDRVKGEDLAGLAGYSFNGRFRESLAALVKDGTIVNVKGQGYALPDQ